MIEPTLLAQVPVVAIAFAIGSLLNPANINAIRRLYILSGRSSKAPGERTCAMSPADSEPQPDKPQIGDNHCLDRLSIDCQPTERQPAQVDDVPAPRAKRTTETWEERTAAEHALALLAWLQVPGGLTGEVPVPELQAIHLEMCAEYGWATRSWISVGRELRRALGQEKTYGIRRGHKVRIYRIPTAIRRTDRVPLRQVA